MRDAIVIGGGPAGMSAALYLARYNRSVVLFDTARGRSSFNQVNHNYLGFPDGVPIQRLRELGREQLSRYSHVQVVDEAVERLEGDADGGFVAHATGGTHSGRTLLLSTGVEDHYPRFDGWEPCVGVSLFWCITCDG